MRGPIARGTIRTSLVLGLRLVVQAGTLLLVARMLGPDRFGAFAGVAALALILGTLSTFGTHLVVLKEVSCDPVRREEIYRYAVPTTLIFGGVLLLAYLLASMWLLGVSGISVAVLLTVGITEMLLQPLFALPAAEHLALGRIARSQLLSTLPLTLRLLSAVTVLSLGVNDPLVAYGYGYLLASLSALLVASYSMPGPWPAPRNWRLPNRGELRVAWGYAALNITAAGPAELDKTLATKLLPLELAGLYAAAARIIGASSLPVIAMMLSALPRLFREGQLQTQRTIRLLSWIFAAALVYGLVLATLLWFIAPAFSWLLGPQYEGIEMMIHWLILVVPGVALRMAAGSALMALGVPWMRVAFEVIGLIVLVVAAISLTPQFDGVGMTLALVSSEWVMAIAGWALVLRSIQIARVSRAQPINGALSKETSGDSLEALRR